MPRKVEISGLSKWFGELEALTKIDVAVEQGEFISVVGPSGCGKTTFLRIVAGLEPATSGTILIDGQPLSGSEEISRFLVGSICSRSSLRDTKGGGNSSAPFLNAQHISSKKRRVLGLTSENESSA